MNTLSLFVKYEIVGEANKDMIQNIRYKITTILIEISRHSFLKYLFIIFPLYPSFRKSYFSIKYSKTLPCQLLYKLLPNIFCNKWLIKISFFDIIVHISGLFLYFWRTLC